MMVPADHEQLLDTLEHAQFRQMRAHRWMRLIGVAIAIAYAVTLAVIATAFDSRELGRGFEYTAQNLAANLGEQLADELDEVAPVLAVAARDGLAKAWPEILGQAEKRFVTVRKQVIRATGQHLDKTVVKLQPRVEQALVKRFESLADQPEKRSGIARAFLNAMSTSITDRAEARLDRGQDAVIRGYATLEALTEDGIEAQEIKERLISILRYFSEHRRVRPTASAGQNAERDAGALER